MKLISLALVLGSSSLALTLPAMASGRPVPVSTTPLYAQVIDTRPIYRTVRIAEPRQECHEERVVHRSGGNEGYWFDNGTAGSFAGAIAGGVAGHQFGKGRGKDAATALGALIGAGIGQRVAVTQSRPTREHVSYETRCHTVDQYRIEDRVEGYDVTYRYQGQTYQTRMPYDPGARLPINVRVEPALRH